LQKKLTVQKLVAVSILGSSDERQEIEEVATFTKCTSQRLAIICCGISAIRRVCGVEAEG